MRHHRSHPLFAALVLALVPLCRASAANEPTLYNLEINPQPLGSALQEFAKQSGVQIIFFSQLTEGRQAPALRGRFTADGALKVLLDDSKLTWREINPKTIEIRPLAAVNSLSNADPADSAGSATSSQGQEGKKSSSDGFRVAQVDQGQTSGSSTVERQDEQADRKKVVELEE